MSSFKASDKVWVYTSAKEFTPSQKDFLLQRAEAFLKSWESHGDKVKGEIGIAYDHFVIVVADDCGGNMCGRAQDAQVRFIKEIGEELGIDLTDRMQLAYKADNSSSKVLVKKMPDFKQEIQLGNITADTIVFNNMITTFGEFRDQWETQLKNSWHKQLMN
ncbi:hypothetical protein [Parvicella tangerina]|uniref:ABC transporter ATPase n=1 Tax=Parvicella tangerina TaxID=2829795 RepID=A0A916NHZ9_9FLAO|nr:hypothetical protein [Parvicella tangerina]CAG5082676.1 hypothetical protein CRYO30217_01980 [Parvicella tangerina]